MPRAWTGVEAVPFARPGARFTRDFEALVAWCATQMDKTALCALVGIDWDTVGRICQRVMADELHPDRLDGSFNIGVDEISWRQHHNYLTLVADHDTGNPSDVKERLDMLSATTGRPVAYYVREAIVKYMGDRERAYGIAAHAEAARAGQIVSDQWMIWHVN